MSSALELQVWFGPADRPRYGWLALPADRQVRGGVVLCAPMGEESRAAHRTFRRLGQRLAAEGFAALRFDYDGTGDSSGCLADVGRLEAWLASVADARRFLAGIGAERISLVGMRLGATLAAAAAREDAAGSLVLWDPCESGRTFLREGQALHALAFAGTAPDGRVDTAGFQYLRESARELRGLRLNDPDAGAGKADRTLVMVRSDRAPAADTIDRLAAAGAEVGQAAGQHLLLDVPPSDAVVPEESLARVVAWLAEGEPTALSPVTPPEDRAASVVASDSGQPLREESRWFVGGEVYGVVTEAVGEPRAWVVLVNVANEHHVGPGRRWVDWARTWAAAGFSCVRIDQSGVGNSPTRPGEPDDLTFSKWWLDDICTVVRELRADGRPVCLVALCSGAYSALEAALGGEASAVDAVVALNPRLTLFEAAKGTPAYTTRPRRAAMIPAAPVAALARRHRILAGAIWRSYRQVAVWHAPAVVLRRVVGRGTTLSVLAAPEDARHFREVLFWRLLPWPGRPGSLVLRSDPRVDHSLLTHEAQEVAAAWTTEFLERRYPA